MRSASGEYSVERVRQFELGDGVSAPDRPNRPRPPEWTSNFRRMRSIRHRTTAGLHSSRSRSLRLPEISVADHQTAQVRDVGDAAAHVAERREERDGAEDEHEVLRRNAGRGNTCRSAGREVQRLGQQQPVDGARRANRDRP